MKWYKKIGFFSALAVTALGLLGCAGQEKSSGDGKVTIEYFNQKTEMADTIQAIIDDFEKENPNIDVKLTTVPSAGIVLKTRILAGDVPDIINIYPQNMDFQEWAGAGYFADMTGKDYLKNIKNNYAQKYAIDDKVYSVPLTANVSGIYYNKTKFQELGLEVPKTFAAFKDLVEQIKAKGETPFATAGTEGWTLNGYHQLSLITITGSADAANDYLRYSPVNSIKASDPILQADAQRLNLLADDSNEMKNWRGASYNDAVVAFAGQNALMMSNGSWALAAINQQDPQFEVGMFAFPGEKEGEEATVGAGDLALSISATTKHPKETEKFIAYMTSAKAMQKYYDVDGSPVAVEGVRENPDSALAELNKLAFTDKHYIWMGQHWNSEEDFFNLSANYLLSKDLKAMADELNAFFNPMKADLD
ncbi:Multiple sugar ABC transporter, substrate-binding protein [Streptococcus sp. DD11]|uniref:extracellular solute-binding protein n=1 Tax=Streptococcus sp. DD11 TaxID=1777879 RepID=UPI0007976A8F|nr:extracellular solute-binding protein [Streptococcus sp. DD11]KXT79791.1 Multiple sugar ABC transporter, substrate-binding protein [Streptococcus sp. DD11]